jgi:hypothetical protein
MTIRNVLFTFVLALTTLGCTRVLDQKAVDAVDGTFDGKVLRSTHAGVAEGSRCSGTLRRERGEPTAKVVVRCGDTVLYDGTGRFELAIGDSTRRDDDAVTFADTSTSEVDGSPAVKFGGEKNQADGSGGTLNLWDAPRGPAPAYEIVIAL